LELCCTGLSAAFDFYSWRISYLELRTQKKRGESVWDEVVGSKDPSIFTVFLEDSASLIGILIAFCGILLGQISNRPYFDPAASILIGILLFGTAALLGRESGALLVGERTRSATILKVERILRDEPSIEKSRRSVDDAARTRTGFTNRRGTIPARAERRSFGEGD
jgi:divalent metal cation (Fe/Co/Zn/Cd) transporter